MDPPRASHCPNSPPKHDRVEKKTDGRNNSFMNSSSKTLICFGNLAHVWWWKTIKGGGGTTILKNKRKSSWKKWNPKFRGTKNQKMFDVHHPEHRLKRTKKYKNKKKQKKHIQHNKVITKRNTQPHPTHPPTPKKKDMTHHIRESTTWGIFVATCEAGAVGGSWSGRSLKSGLGSNSSQGPKGWPKGSNRFFLFKGIYQLPPQGHPPKTKWLQIQYEMNLIWEF